MNVLIPGTPPIPTKNDWFDKSVQTSPTMRGRGRDSGVVALWWWGTDARNSGSFVVV